MGKSHQQNAGQNHNIQRANKSFESVEIFKHLRMTLINQTHTQDMSRLNSGTACYNSVQNLLSFHLLTKNVKVGL
jgi:hypothetical protein